eukprot:4820874-Pyramimonas_sp.AAC.1
MERGADRQRGPDRLRHARTPALRPGPAAHFLSGVAGCRRGVPAYSGTDTHVVGLHGGGEGLRAGAAASTLLSCVAVGL